MSNEADLRQSIAEIFAADSSTAGTGIVDLTGKAQPIVRWGDRGMNDRPIVTYFVPNAGFRTGSKDALRMTVQFDIFVEPSSTGLEEQIADRIEAIVTYSNLNSTARTSPVDAAPYWRARRELPELDEGRRRLTLEAELWFTRT